MTKEIPPEPNQPTDLVELLKLVLEKKAPMEKFLAQLAISASSLPKEKVITLIELLQNHFPSNKT